MRRSILGLILLLLAACQGGQTRPVAPRELPIAGAVAGVAGRLLYANGAQLRTFEIGTGKITPLTTFPPDISADGPAISPDQSLIAFALYRPGGEAADAGAGVDLMVMNADGSSQRTVLAHSQPDESLAEPAWAPDGRTLFFTYRNPNTTTRIERVNVDGTERAVVVPQGRSPSVSADGAHLAFLMEDESTGHEVLAVAAIGGEIRRVFAGGSYQALAAPRFAPDGQRIVFSGVMERPESRALFQPDIPAWLRPRVALAHGVPWEIWVVNADGSGREQMTDFQEDSPIAAWSPDGSQLAIKGELGFYLLELQSKKLLRLAQELAGDGLAWLGR